MLSNNNNSKVDVACVGLDAANTMLIKSVIRLYNRSGKNLRGYDWHFTENIDADMAVNTLGMGIEADLLIIDTDSDAGRHAWYTLQALYPEDTLVVLSEDPKAMRCEHFLKKPLAAERLVEILKSLAKINLR